MAVDFTVRFRGTGYKEIEPLQSRLVSGSMLGSKLVKFVSIDVNDGKLLKYGSLSLHILSCDHLSSKFN